MLNLPGSCLKIKIPRTSLEVQRLTLHAYDARGVEIQYLVMGTKISHVKQCAPPQKGNTKIPGKLPGDSDSRVWAAPRIISDNFIIRLLYHLGHTC